MKELGRLKFLTAIAIGAAAILVYHDTKLASGFQVGPSFCAINDWIDCDAVSKSPFSTFLGFPISTYALGFYLAFYILLSVLKGADKTTSYQLTSLWSTVSVVPSVLMLVISAFIIKKLCIYCMILYVTSLAIFLVLFFSKERTASFLTNVGKGAILSFYFVLNFFGFKNTNEQSFRLARLGGSGLIFLGVAVAGLPGLLVMQVFVPEAQSTKRQDAITESVEAWEKSPVVDLNLSNSKDPRNKDFSIGSNNATLTVVEFSDYECPFCKKAGAILKEVVREHEGKVRLVHRDFPLDNACNRAINRTFHKDSCRLAAAVRCAGQQGDEQFWKMNKIVYGLSSVNEKRIADLPEEAGLNPSEFNQCISSPDALEKIKQDVEAGLALNINATPTLYVNGKLLHASSPEILPEIIRTIVRKKIE